MNDKRRKLWQQKYHTIIKSKDHIHWLLMVTVHISVQGRFWCDFRPIFFHFKINMNVHFRRTWMCSFYSHADSAWVFPPFSRKFPSFSRKVPNTKLTTIFKKCTVAGPSQGIHRNPPMYPNVRRNLAQGQLFVSFPNSRYAAYILLEKIVQSEIDEGCPGMFRSTGNLSTFNTG